jgi:hypothetical protein
MQTQVYTVDRISDGVVTLLCNKEQSICLNLSSICQCTQEVKEGDIVLVVWHQDVGGPCTLRVLTEQTQLKKQKVETLLNKLNQKKR